MELIIDNTRCNLLEGSIPKLEFMPLKVDSVEELRSGWSIQFTLPSTPTNNALMCYSATPHTESEFNHELHYAYLKCEGTTLLKGVVRLLKVEPETPQACYLIEIRGGAPHWAKLASERRVKELQLESDLRLTPSDIVLSWSNDSPIKFLPVAYDSYLPTQSDSSSIIPLERMLSCDDYLPFLNIRALIEKIFSDAGYTLKSKFLDSDLFNSLYMSGAFTKHNVDVQRERMDFYASRLADIESTANHLGRVYASTGILVNSIGNIVDSFKPTNIDQDGEPTYNCFSNGGYLKFEDGELCFRPPSTINVGFHYTLCYNTSYSILSRERLQGFDSVYLGEGADFRMQIKNPFIDRRGATNPGQRYLIVPFSHSEGNSYRLKCGSTIITEFEDSHSYATLPLSLSSKPKLELYNPGTGSWQSYEEDWALYDGHISTTGDIDVEISIRTTPESVGPNSPKYFNQIYFYGAEPGMRLRLKRQSSLTPDFRAQPGFGAKLRFEDIASLNMPQSRVLDAMIHMFNLRIVTDEDRKEVVIEPEEQLFDGAKIKELHSRQLAETLHIELLDSEEFESRIYGYQSGEGEVKRLSKELEEEFGSWESSSISKATKQGVERITNPLFAPTINISHHNPAAQSALIPSIGDRDVKESLTTADFTPRIVSYLGLKSLPTGESLPYPAPEGQYPLSAFHFTGDEETPALTLCFENRDGIEGLNRFYKEREESLIRGRRIRVSLRIAPHELEHFTKLTNGDGWGIDSLFSLKIDGEPTLCRLERIESYTPKSHTLNLSFLTTNN